MSASLPFPHPALQSVVYFVAEAREFSFSDVKQAKEPELLEVAVGPALVIDSTATAFQTAPLFWDGAQSGQGEPGPSHSVRQTA